MDLYFRLYLDEDVLQNFHTARLNVLDHPSIIQ